MSSQRYDLIVQPAAGSTPEQLQTMWRNMFETRMKLAAHYETVQEQVFALVNTTKDGSVPRKLIRSNVDCGTPRAPNTEQLAPPQRLPNGATPCGLMLNANSLLSGGITMVQLAQSIRGAVGGLVLDRTGLEGRYVFSLTYNPASVAPGTQSELPSIFSAVQEQLGLRLETQKSDVQILVIDHAEPPSEN
jgi:uncharacterized protein (TIGR03435 family)